MVRSGLAGVLFLVAATVHPAAAHESWSEWITRIFGVGGTRTFVGYLSCTDTHVLGGCLPNGTHFVTISGLTDIECTAYKNAAQAAGGSGGACL
jgi:hypothetical protein